MKTNTYLIPVTLGISLLLSSCENIIEADLPTSQLETAQVFESVSTADGALSNLYAELQYYSVLSGGTGGTGALLGTYTDDLTCYIIGSQNNAPDLFHNQQLATNTEIRTVWTNAWKEIYSANAIIEGVEKSSGIGTTDKDRIKGEALFVRSLLYFYLTQIYDAVPYTTTTDYKINQTLRKTPVSELLLKVQGDLETASALLQDTYRNIDRVYPNRKTAELMLALTLMQQKKWPEAEQRLKNVVQSPLYVWEPDVAKTFKKSGKHILWQLKPLKANEPTQEAFMYYFSSAAPVNYGLSENLVSSFSPADLRRQQWIKAVTINQTLYYRNDKYKNTVSNADEYSAVFRLEEVYLLLAEALAQQNKIEEALPYINAVRQRAGISPLAGSTRDALLNEIVAENRREFFAEKGHRFLTLKRNDQLNNLTDVKPNWQPHHRVWPIPLSDILLNPGLNPQNTGY